MGYANASEARRQGGVVVCAAAASRRGRLDPPGSERSPVGVASGRAALPRGSRMLGALGAAPSRPQAAPTGHGMRQDALEAAAR